MAGGTPASKATMTAEIHLDNRIGINFFTSHPIIRGLHRLTQAHTESAPRNQLAGIGL
jgi:hypothetical protein